MCSCIIWKYHSQLLEYSKFLSNISDKNFLVKEFSLFWRSFQSDAIEPKSEGWFYSKLSILFIVKYKSMVNKMGLNLVAEKESFWFAAGYLHSPTWYWLRPSIGISLERNFKSNLCWYWSRWKYVSRQVLVLFESKVLVCFNIWD